MKLNAGMMIGAVGGVVGLAVGLAAIIMTGDPITIGIFSTVMIGVGALMYFLFFKPALDYSRIMKTGKSATGTVLSMSETGTRINNQPLIKFELQVELPGAPSYVTTAKTVISYLQVSQFQPGTKVPLMVDSKDNMKVVFIKQGDMPKNTGTTNTNPLANASATDVKALQDKLMELQKSNEEIKAIGIYSKAIVTKFTNMGVNVNGMNPLATIEVQVLPDNEPAFAATVKGIVKDTSIPLFQPGEEIFVKYDPNDKTRVSIEHS